MKKTTNTFGVTFYLKKYKANNGKVPIYLRITIDGRRADISLKRTINEKNWNESKGLARGGREDVKALNIFLEQVRSRIVECYQEMVLQKKIITAEAIKNSFLGGDLKEYTLCMLMKFHNTNMSDTLAWGTMKNYFTTQKYIQSFLKTRFNSSDLFLDSLSYKWRFRV